MHITTEIEQLNEVILAAHHNHYKESPTGLIRPTESPNANIIYHLYSTGEISSQKGGWAYMQRSEFMSHGILSYYKNINMVFAKKAADNSTYVILTEEECKYFREKMKECIRQSLTA